MSVKIVSLTHWYRDVSIAVSQGRIQNVARDLRAYYDGLPWWAWLRGIRVRWQLRVVTVVQDAYQMGWQDGSRGKRWG